MSPKKSNTKVHEKFCNICVILEVLSNYQILMDPPKHQFLIELSHHGNTTPDSGHITTAQKNTAPYQVTG